MTASKRRMAKAPLFDPLLIAGETRAPSRRGMPWEEQLMEQLLARGLPAPAEEYFFAALLGRRWRFDLAWPGPGYRIAFEQEGAVFGRVVEDKDGQKHRLGGRHNSGAGMQADCEKYSRAAILGWCVIRATTTMIRDGQAIELLVDAFKARGWKEPGDVAITEKEGREEEGPQGQLRAD